MRQAGKHVTDRSGDGQRYAEAGRGADRRMDRLAVKGQHHGRHRAAAHELAGKPLDAQALGRALQDAGQNAAALDAYARGIEAARAKGDRQAEKEMTVFKKRLEKAAPAPGKDPR